MPRLFDIYTTTDEGLAELIEQYNWDISVAAFRAELDQMIRWEEESPAVVGSFAPDFEAERLTAQAERSGEMFRLSSLRGKVTALMFGSYTCPVCSSKMPRHQEVFLELRNEVEFIWVYTFEAHAYDEWQTDSNEARGVRINAHRNLDDRADAASECMLGAGLTIPMVMDDMDNSITRLYNGAPERLYVIDRESKITFRSDIGPFDGQDLEDWYAELLAQTKRN